MRSLCRVGHKARPRLAPASTFPGCAPSPGAHCPCPLQPDGSCFRENQHLLDSRVVCRPEGPRSLRGGWENVGWERRDSGHGKHHAQVLEGDMHLPGVTPHLGAAPGGGCWPRRLRAQVKMPPSASRGQLPGFLDCQPGLRKLAGLTRGGGCRPRACGFQHVCVIDAARRQEWVKLLRLPSAWKPRS